MSPIWLLVALIVFSGALIAGAGIAAEDFA